MAKKKYVPNNKPVGRPEYDIDWKKVDSFLIAGCTGREVACNLGIHEDTFYRQIQRKFNVNFSDYAAAKYSTGDGLLKATRFQKAIKGNVQLMLYLSEVRLKEKRGEDLSSFDVETLQQFNQLMAQINKAQQSNSESSTTQESSDLNMEESNINTEQRS